MADVSVQWVIVPHGRNAGYLHPPFAPLSPSHPCPHCNAAMGPLPPGLPGPSQRGRRYKFLSLRELARKDRRGSVYRDGIVAPVCEEVRAISAAHLRAIRRGEPYRRVLTEPACCLYVECAKPRRRQETAGWPVYPYGGDVEGLQGNCAAAPGIKCIAGDEGLAEPSVNAGHASPGGPCERSCAERHLYCHAQEIGSSRLPRWPRAPRKPRRRTIPPACRLRTTPLSFWGWALMPCCRPS